MRGKPKGRVYVRYKQATFGVLLPGYCFKASKTHHCLWKKVDGEWAESMNGGLRQRWCDNDTVWIDVSTNLFRPPSV